MQGSCGFSNKDIYWQMFILGMNTRERKSPINFKAAGNTQLLSAPTGRSSSFFSVMEATAKVVWYSCFTGANTD